MAFNVSGLRDYVKNDGQLIAKVLSPEGILNNKNFPITWKTGIKRYEVLNYFDQEVNFQAEGCDSDWTTSGTTTLTDKLISATRLKYHDSLCPADLDEKSVSLQLSAGNNTSIPFEGLWVESVMNEIKRKNGIMVQANAASGTTNCEGWLHMMLADSDVHDVTTGYLSVSGSTMTDDQWHAFFKSMIDGLPVKYRNKPNVGIVMGTDQFLNYQFALLKGNKYHIDPTQPVEFLLIPSTKYKIIQDPGLDGLNYCYLTYAENLVGVADLKNEEEFITVKWDGEMDGPVKLSVHWKLGVSYYFGDAIVLGR